MNKPEPETGMTFVEGGAILPVFHEDASAGPPIERETELPIPRGPSEAMSAKGEDDDSSTQPEEPQEAC